MSSFNNSWSQSCNKPLLSSISKCRILILSFRRIGSSDCSCAMWSSGCAATAVAATKDLYSVHTDDCLLTYAHIVDKGCGVGHLHYYAVFLFDAQSQIQTWMASSHCAIWSSGSSKLYNHCNEPWSVHRVKWLPNKYDLKCFVKAITARRVTQHRRSGLVSNLLA